VNLDEVPPRGVDEEDFGKNLHSFCDENSSNGECDSPIPYRHGVSHLEALSMDEARKQKEAFMACSIQRHIEEPHLMDMDEDYPLEAQPSPYEHFENKTHEEYLKEDDWVEVFHERKREIDALFIEFQRNHSFELGAEIRNKIEENNTLLNFIQKRDYLVTTLKEDVSTLY